MTTFNVINLSLQSSRYRKEIQDLPSYSMNYLIDLQVSFIRGLMKQATKNMQSDLNR